MSRTQHEPLEKWDDVEYFKSIGVPIISQDEAKARAGNLSTNVFEKWDLLHALIIRTEAIVQKRWLKKPKHKRIEILLKA